jgi:integrase
MARPKANRPSYYASRNGWYCWHRGKQIQLASGPKDETEQAALRAFYELQLAVEPEQAARSTSVVACMDAYLDHAERHLGADTFDVRRRYCRSFYQQSPAAREDASQLRPHHITAWIAQHPNWAPGTAALATETILAAMNHCRKQGIIDANPIAGMAKPRKRSRSNECVLTRSEHVAIVANARSFALFIESLYATGARPGELASVTARELKQIQGVWVLDLSKHKTARHGKSRLIVLPDTIAAKLRELALQYPAGPIFRNTVGKPLNRQSIAELFDRIRERLNLREQITAYSYRHTFATEWLLAGKSVALLAQIMGNSIKTIEHHYSHLLHDVTALKAQLDSLRD